MSSTFLPVAEPDLGALEEAYLLDAYRSGWISSIGPYVERLETAFATFCEAKYAIAVSNGTVAIHLALVAAGIGAGDEVIVPALSFVATAAAVVHAGAKPVFVDVDPVIGTMEPTLLEAAVSTRTKAIVPVHLYGHPADMDPLLETARRHGLMVLEDAAEAHGARYRGQRVGGIGTVGTFSFYGNKLMTTGEGGMVVTSDEGLARKIRFLKDHAMDPRRRYWHTEVGFNYRLTNLQAAIGCAQLERFEELRSKRAAVFSLYQKDFADMPNAYLNPRREWAEPAPWLVCMLLREGRTGGERDSIADGLRRGAVDSRPYFVPLTELPPYRGCAIFSGRQDGRLNAALLADRGLNLPSSTCLRDVDVTRVSSACRAALTKLGEIEHQS